MIRLSIVICFSPWSSAPKESLSMLVTMSRVTVWPVSIPALPEVRYETAVCMLVCTAESLESNTATVSKIHIHVTIYMQRNIFVLTLNYLYANKLSTLEYAWVQGCYFGDIHFSNQTREKRADKLLFMTFQCPWSLFPQIVWLVLCSFECVFCTDIQHVYFYWLDKHLMLNKKRLKVHNIV